MRIFLIRHGIAADQSPDGSDELRPLTAEGIAGLEEEAETLNRLDITWDIILTSPLVRASQTAAVFGARLEGKPPVVLAPALAPPALPAAVAATLLAHQTCRRVALVGHEPAMGMLVAHWVGMPAPLSFKKGAICRLDMEPPFRPRTATLRWFAPPKLLRALDP